METSSADVQEQHPQLHDDKSGQIAAVVSVMIVLATSAVALRLFTRRLTATSLKLDDYGIIAALVSIYLWTLTTFGIRVQHLHESDPCLWLVCHANCRYGTENYLLPLTRGRVSLTLVVLGIQYGAGKHQADVDFETIAQIFKVGGARCP